MSCIPNIPIAADIRDSGWLVFPSVDLTTLAQWEPVDAAILTAVGMVEERRQAFEIVQVQVRETASSAANLKKNSINILFFTDTAPPPPVEGVVYNPSVSNSLGVAVLTPVNYVRFNDTAWVATVNPSLQCVSGVLSTASNIYIAAVFADGAPLQYVAGATLEVRIFVRLNQTTI